ncbi:hypothetical protein UKMH10_5072 [Burkholderia pseudomallei]|nr:hypothetical protein SZ31_23460 [Burkholderia pseudomallei]OMU93901.1 hypothetical protein AQ781_21370 [Burkholderia pseudomallei]VUD61947.1 unnamed protein product [Burkholderia pseudomallei]VUD67104.1 hypothetical protein UKMH10_5072 [Burkholderia pseudomallei]
MPRRRRTDHAPIMRRSRTDHARSPLAKHASVRRASRADGGRPPSLIIADRFAADPPLAPPPRLDARGNPPPRSPT